MNEQQEENHRQLSKKEAVKLIELNEHKYGVDFHGKVIVNTLDHWFTIVTLETMGKHYHGLAAKTPKDIYKRYTGVAIAFNRAFEQMAVDAKEAEKKKMEKLFSEWMALVNWLSEDKNYKQ